MIAMRKIHLTKISLISSLSSSANKRYWMLKNSHVDRRFELGNLRDFSADMKVVMPSTRLEEVPELEFPASHPVFEKIRQENHKRATIGYMIHAIQQLCNSYFLDPKLRHDNNLSIDMWEAEDTCNEYWLSVLKLSQTSLVIELRKKLKNSDIPLEDFCRTIVDIYFILNNCSHFILPDIRVEPEDVINVIKYLKFHNSQYECLKILFSLHDSYGWQI